MDNALSIVNYALSTKKVLSCEPTDYFLTCF